MEDDFPVKAMLTEFCDGGERWGECLLLLRMCMDAERATLTNGLEVDEESALEESLLLSRDGCFTLESSFMAFEDSCARGVDDDNDDAGVDSDNNDDDLVEVDGGENGDEDNGVCSFLDATEKLVLVTDNVSGL